MTKYMLAAALVLAPAAAPAETLRLEDPAAARDGVLKRLNGGTPGDFSPLAPARLSAWEREAERVLANRFPGDARTVAVEVTPFGIVRLSGWVRDAATAAAMARALLARPGLGLAVESGLRTGS